MEDDGDRKYLMVAAIDFGTTYSGYAFSMRSDFKTDPLKIKVNVWNARGRAPPTYKVPTCLLLDKDKNFVAFGYDAEDKYTNLVLEKKHEDNFYFHRFKMHLHNNKNITHDMKLEDVCGKKLSAIRVFKFAIGHLMDHLMSMVNDQGTTINKDEIQWVLTVPAIWTDIAKGFMRSSAEEAKIQSDKLILALEPEAASIFCQYLPIEKLLGTEKGFTMTETGTKYMVVDLGGGTADITVHQKASNGQLKELCRAVGNDCGGTSVDKKFLKMLEKIVGEKVISECKEKFPLGYLELLREFESVKRNVGLNQTEKVNVTIPISFLDAKCKEIQNEDFKSLINSSSFSEDVNILYDKLRIKPEIVNSFFTDAITEIIELMKVTLSKKDTRNVSKILMVGGFSECQLIQNAVRKEFPDTRIIIPEEAGLSVLKGAVLFGHRPNYIQTRVMRVSYGVKTNHPFDEKKYDEKHKVVMDGEERCDNIFSQIAVKDQPVEAGTKVERSYQTSYKNQEEMHFEIYISEKPYPSYIDDEGCSFLCKPTITFPDLCEEKRWVDVEYVFGNTEIGLKAVDRNTKKEITAKINLV